MLRWLKNAGKSGALLVIALVIFLIAGGDKIVQKYWAGVGSTGSQTGTSPAREYRVDFEGEPTAANLFFSNDPTLEEAYFERKEEHRLLLIHLFGTAYSIDTNDTFINYRNGRLVWLRVYLAPDTVGFRDAVRVVDRQLNRAGVGQAFDAREYDRHMGEVTDHEIWVPTFKLGRATLVAELNCNWEWHQTAREQAARVSCRPLFNITMGGGAGTELDRPGHD